MNPFFFFCSFNYKLFGFSNVHEILEKKKERVSGNILHPLSYNLSRNHAEKEHVEELA